MVIKKYGKLAFLLCIAIIVAFVVIIPINSNSHRPGSTVAGRSVAERIRAENLIPSSSPSENDDTTQSNARQGVLGIFNNSQVSSSASSIANTQPSSKEQNKGWFSLPDFSGVSKFFEGIGQRLIENSPQPKLELSRELKKEVEQNTSLAQVNIFDKARSAQKEQSVEGKIIWRESLPYSVGTDKFDFGTGIEVNIDNQRIDLTVDSTPLLTTETVLIVDRVTFQKLGGDPQKQTTLSAVVKKRQNN